MKRAALLILFVAIGCQKDVHEVRRTDPTKYSVDSGGYGVKTENLEVQSGRYGAQSGSYGAQAGTYGASAGTYGASTGSYGAQSGRYAPGGVAQGSPSAPRQQPVGLPGAPSSIGR